MSIEKDKEITELLEQLTKIDQDQNELILKIVNEVAKKEDKEPRVRLPISYGKFEKVMSDSFEDFEWLDDGLCVNGSDMDYTREFLIKPDVKLLISGSLIESSICLEKNESYFD